MPYLSRTPLWPGPPLLSVDGRPHLNRPMAFRVPVSYQRALTIWRLPLWRHIAIATFVAETALSFEPAWPSFRNDDPEWNRSSPFLVIIPPLPSDRTPAHSAIAQRYSIQHVRQCTSWPLIYARGGRLRRGRLSEGPASAKIPRSSEEVVEEQTPD